MTEELKQSILAYTAREFASFTSYIKENYHEIPSTTEELIDFAKKHSATPLPDDFFLSDKKQNVNIGVHGTAANGIMHSHEFFELIYVAQGEVTDFIDGVEICLPEGSVCIHNPKALHKIVRCSESDFLINFAIRRETFENVIFLPIIAEPTLNRFFLRYSAMEDCTNFMAFPARDRRIDEIIELLVLEFLDEGSNEHLILSLIFLLFGTLLRGYQTDPFTDRLLVYLSEHIESATLGDCAQYFKYHEKYFSSLVKKHLGKSFKQVQTELRIRKAAVLLSYTEQTITDISYGVGYQDPAVFYLNFKKITGMTPSEYRASKAPLT